MGSQKPPRKFIGQVTPELYDADTQLNTQSKSQGLAWIRCRIQSSEDQKIIKGKGWNRVARTH